MKKTILFLIVLFMVSTAFAQTDSQLTTDKAAIKNVISQYAESIDNADTIIAGKIFLKSATISYIHPKGYVQGWEGVKKDIYGMFREAFSQRALKIYNNDIQIYGNMAVAVFYWVFDATFKDGTIIQTKGRETQVYNKIDGEWKILHVHYSHMPITGEKNGF